MGEVSNRKTLRPFGSDILTWNGGGGGHQYQLVKSGGMLHCQFQSDGSKVSHSIQLQLYICITDEIIIVYTRLQVT